MAMRYVCGALALLAVTASARAEPATPGMRASEVRLVGTIRKIDARRHTIVIAYAPLETAPGGVRSASIASSKDRADLEVGEAISAIADTRHSPWSLRDVRVLR